MRFRNQVAVITGASSGIGKALAKALSSEGCHVGLIARRQELLESLTEEITESGGTAAFAPADVGNHSQVKDAVASIGQRLGPIDLLIANAGMSFDVELDPLNVAEIEQVFRVNFFGAVYAIDAVLPSMLERQRGHLAVVSSLGSVRGFPTKQAYTASKMALSNFAEGLRVHLRSRGVTMTTICPGFVRTPMTSKFTNMFWALEPDDAARRIVRALHRKKKVLNFPWATTMVMKLATWLPDWMIARAMRRYLD